MSNIIVDNRNFEKVIKEIPQLIEKSSSCAIDLEFSGINLEKRDEVNFLDTFTIRYAKMKKSVTSHAVFSVGLTFFFPVKNGPMTYKSFDFLLMKNFGGFINFSINNKSMKINAQTLDFNRIFKHGIPYINQTEVELQLKRRLRSNRNKIKLTTPIEWIETIATQVHAWFTNELRNDQFIATPQNDFQIKLLFHRFHGAYNGRLYLESEKFENQRKFVSFTKVDDVKKSEMQFATKATGFSRVIALLKGYSKPIIGYNCFLDLGHIVDKFINPLPATLDEFKTVLHEYFPVIIDAKHYVSVTSFNGFHGTNISLRRMYNYLSILGFVENKFDPTDLQFHTSLFDSYATGVVYYNLLNGIRDLGKTEINKLFLIKQKDHINLTKPQFDQCRNNVIVLTNIPVTVCRSELDSRLNRCFGLKSEFINIDDVTGYLVLYKLKRLGLNVIKKYLKKVCGEFHALGRYKMFRDYYDAPQTITPSSEIDDLYLMSKSVSLSLGMIKPDTVKRGEDEKIFELIKQTGLDVCKKKKVMLTKEMAKDFYKERTGKHSFEQLVNYTASGEQWVFILSGIDCIRKWRDLIGPTDPLSAKKTHPTSIRSKFGSEPPKNAVHGSENELAAKREIGFFFPKFVTN